MNRDKYQTLTMTWNSIAMTINYCESWMTWLSDEEKADYMAHIEILRDDKKQLPMTETGYRSHFIRKAVVDNSGGVLDYVKAWLDHEGQSKKWKDYVANEAQLKLF